tara:strand:- start:381 stop:1130 length:750 start_codon:yes stop_codon:yes gene_type:complete
MKINSLKVLITGGASGIGLGLCKKLDNLGAKVIVIDINENQINKLKKKSSNIDFYCCDITDYNSLDLCLESIVNSQGVIDVLVNNAGLMTSAPLIDLFNTKDKRHSAQLWKKTLDVNLNSAFYLTSCIVENMINARKKGIIINMSSISAKGNAGQSAYSAAKAALEALTKVWSKELGPFGIRCAAIAPGFTNTKGTQCALEEKKLSKWVTQTPIKRLAEIDEIVNALIFVIENDFFNGKTLQIDGGLTI